MNLLQLAKFAAKNLPVLISNLESHNLKFSYIASRSLSQGNDPKYEGKLGIQLSPCNIIYKNNNLQTS